jgi:hypothetical protein
MARHKADDDDQAEHVIPATGQESTKDTGPDDGSGDGENVIPPVE